MKTCQRCLHEFVPDENRIENPADGLGEMFLQTAEIHDIEDLCPDCIEELGILNVLGFDS